MSGHEMGALILLGIVEFALGVIVTRFTSTFVQDTREKAAFAQRLATARLLPDVVQVGLLLATRLGRETGNPAPVEGAKRVLSGTQDRDEYAATLTNVVADNEVTAGDFPEVEGQLREAEETFGRLDEIQRTFRLTQASGEVAGRSLWVGFGICLIGVAGFVGVGLFGFPSVATYILGLGFVGFAVTFGLAGIRVVQGRRHLVRLGELLEEEGVGPPEALLDENPLLRLFRFE